MGGPFTDTNAILLQAVLADLQSEDPKRHRAGLVRLMTDDAAPLAIGPAVRQDVETMDAFEVARMRHTILAILYDAVDAVAKKNFEKKNT